MISAGELARRAGVKKQAITYQVKRGYLTRVVDAKGKTGFDENAPEIQTYINSQAGQRLSAHDLGAAPAPAASPRAPKPRAPAQPRQDPAPMAKLERSEGEARAESDEEEEDEELEGEDDLEKGLEFLDKNELDRHKIREQVIRARIQNKVERGKYLPRDDVRKTFGRVYSVHTSILRPLGSKIGPDLAALFGSTDDALALKAIQMVDAEIYRSLGMIKRQLNSYLEATGASPLAKDDALPELAPQEGPAE